MAEPSVLYEIPIFLFLAVAIYTFYQMREAQSSFKTKGPLKESFKWLTFASFFFILLGFNHLFHDVAPLPGELSNFFHYIVCHGFLLFAVICIAIAAKKTQNFAYVAYEKGKGSDTG